MNNVKKGREEATAQAKALQELAARRGQTLTPGSLGVNDRVQWEATPTRFGKTRIDAPYSKPSPSWRVDIAVEDPAAASVGILEVKRWVNNSLTPALVDNQLDNPITGTGYRQRMNAINIRAVRDAELNLTAPGAPFSWVRAYVNPRNTVSCVWADKDSANHAGNVYFTEVANARLPGEIKAVCLDREKQRQLQTTTEAQEQAVSAALKGTLEEAQRESAAAAGIIVFDAAKQETGFDCVGVYYVTVPMSALAVTTLRLNYGDGGPVDEIAIPRGSGAFTAEFTHSFRQGSWTATQTATIVETGAVGTAVTHHDPHNLLGAIQVGVLRVAANDQVFQTAPYANTATVWGEGSIESGDQHVDDTVAYMTNGMRSSPNPGSFTVATDTDEDSGLRLPDGPYDVRFFNGDDNIAGYTDHTHRNIPAGNCITSSTTAPPQVIKVGNVTISGGQIIAATDDLGTVISVTAAGVAGPFSVPGNGALNITAPPKEQAVCVVSSAYGEIGLQAPVTTVDHTRSVARAVATGTSHSLAAKADGTVWAWGDNSLGQLGNGTTASSANALQVPGLTAVTAVAGGWVHSLALKGDGTVWAWGYNGHGELGNGTFTSSSTTPVQVLGLSGVTAIDAGWYHSLALKGDGTVWAWGYNYDGELGNGSTTSELGEGPTTGVATPVQVSGLTGVTAVTAGAYHSLGLKGDGTIWAWGYNGAGELGNGTSTGSSRPVPTLGPTGVTGVAAGAYHSLAVKGDGTVWAWGLNYGGSASAASIIPRPDGRPSATAAVPTPTPPASIPLQVSGLTGVNSVAAGATHSLAVRADGTVWGWGDNSYGQLGDGTTSSRANPMQVSVLTGVNEVSAGAYHSLALMDGGTVWAWGQNYYGQLGDGSTGASATPVQSGISGVG